MKNRWMFRPNLDDCILEDRLPPVVSNLGLVVLTTGGYVMREMRWVGSQSK